MIKREQHINELQDIVAMSISNLKYANYELVKGTIRAVLLHNTLTSELCQIFEVVYNTKNKDGDVFFPEHQHDENYEVFYQLTGTTFFGDGTILKPTEVRVIPPKERHSVKLSEDGACVVIIHPPSKNFPKGDS